MISAFGSNRPDTRRNARGGAMGAPSSRARASVRRSSSDGATAAPAMPRIGALIGYRTELFGAAFAINLLSFALPLAMLHVYDRIIPNAAISTLVLLLGGVLVAFVLDALLSTARAYVIGWNGARVRYLLGTGAMGRLFGAELADVERDPPGAHLERLRAIDTVRSFFGGQAVLLLVDLPFALLFLTMIALIAGPLALVPIVLILLLVAAAVVTGDALLAAIAGRAEADERRYNYVIEVLKGIGTVKSLGLEAQMARRYERLIANSAASSLRVTWSSALARLVGVASGEMMMVAVAAVGALLVMDGVMSSGGLAASMLLAGRATQPILRAFSSWTQFQNVRIAKDRVAQLYAIPETRRAAAPPALLGKGGIRLENAGFTYPGRDRPLFAGVDLAVEHGETVAISGGNGVGKTTLLLLAAGIQLPSTGAVRIAGVDVRALPAPYLQSRICYLPQTAVLFQGSILDNLTMFRGRDAARRAVDLAERLGVHDFIQRQPKGYETVVGDGPFDGLAGGVRQRIGIIRSLVLAEAPWLILFDEANSYLDLASDARLNEVLASYRGSTAMIVVSHRPSFLNLAERRYVLAGGALSPAAARAMPTGTGGVVGGRP